MATVTLPNPKDTKYIDYLAKFKKEAAYFAAERTANGKPWPRAKPPLEKAYDNFLAEVVDPTTGEYYLNVDGTKQGTYSVSMIVRQKNSDGSEWLYSKGTINAFDYFKDEKTFACSKPEVHIKTKFAHRKTLDKRNQVVRSTTGVNGQEEVFEMPFTPENAEKLWALKRDGNIQLIVKNQLNAEPHAVERKGLIRADDFEGAFELFKTAPFEYLYNWDYTKNIPQVREERKLTDKELSDIMEQEDKLKRAQADTRTKLNRSDNPEKVK